MRSAQARWWALLVSVSSIIHFVANAEPALKAGSPVRVSGTNGTGVKAWTEVGDGEFVIKPEGAKGEITDGPAIAESNKLEYWKIKYEGDGTERWSAAKYLTTPVSAESSAPPQTTALAATPEPRAITAAPGVEAARVDSLPERVQEEVPRSESESHTAMQQAQTALKEAPTAPSPPVAIALIVVLATVVGGVSLLGAGVGLVYPSSLRLVLREPWTRGRVMRFYGVLLAASFVTLLVASSAYPFPRQAKLAEDESVEVNATRAADPPHGEPLSEHDRQAQPTAPSGSSMPASTAGATESKEDLAPLFAGITVDDNLQTIWQRLDQSGLVDQDLGLSKEDAQDPQKRASAKAERMQRFLNLDPKEFVAADPYYDNINYSWVGGDSKLEGKLSGLRETMFSLHDSRIHFFTLYIDNTGQWVRLEATIAQDPSKPRETHEFYNQLVTKYGEPIPGRDGKAPLWRNGEYLISYGATWSTNSIDVEYINVPAVMKHSPAAQEEARKEHEAVQKKLEADKGVL